VSGITDCDRWRRFGNSTAAIRRFRELKICFESAGVMTMFRQQRRDTMGHARKCQATGLRMLTVRLRCYAALSGTLSGAVCCFLNDRTLARCAFVRNGEELTPESRAAFSNCPWP